MQASEHSRAQQRAGNGLHTAQQHHGQRINRLVDMQHFRRNTAFGKRIQPTGQPGKNARNHKSQPLHPQPVDTQGFCPQRRIAHRPQGKPERRLQN